MKNFFTLLLMAGIAGSAASVISGNSPLGKYVKYISALICTIIVISPLSSTLKSISTLFPKDDVMEDLISESNVSYSLESTALQLTQEQLCKEIEKNFGIIPIDVCIVIDTDGEITATATLSEADSAFTDEINEFLESYT